MKKEAYIIPILLSLFLIPVFFNPFFVFSFTQGKELLFKSILLLTMFSGGIILFFKKNYNFNNILKSPLFLLLLLQFAISSITDALSPTPIVTLYGTYSRGFGLIIEIYLFFFLVYCASVLSKEKIILFLKVIFFSGLIVSLYALLQKIGIDPFFRTYDSAIFDQRVFSFSGNPSYLGQLMLLEIVIGGYLAYKSANRRIIYVLGTLLFLVALFFSGTRTSMLALGLVMLFLFIKNFRIVVSFIKSKKTYFIFFAIILAVFFAKFQNDRYSISDAGLRSLNSRFEIWKGAIELIKKSPILGYGEETFYIYFPEVITKKFLTLEENLNISADRIHNESLETLYSHGVVSLIIYLTLFVLLVKIFFKKNDQTSGILSLIVLANILQNQFAFSDLTIRVILSFCFGSLIALQAENKVITISPAAWKRYLLAPLLIILTLYGFSSVYKSYMSQLAYAASHDNYDIDYSIAVNKQKEALNYTPQYSELWYGLMFIDPSSMGSALSRLQQIDGDSGNVLAWEGNLYAKNNPDKASQFYIRALEKNPYNPDWTRAFADMLYDKGDYQDALYFYNQYLEAIPDFWKWGTNLAQHSAAEQKTYQTFIKQTPYFPGVIKKINNAIKVISSSSPLP